MPRECKKKDVINTSRIAGESEAESESVENENEVSAFRDEIINWASCC